MKLTDYDAIIFDLGGVVINLDYENTSKVFKSLGLDDFETLYSQAAQTGLFDSFEKGACSIPYFINKLLTYLPSGITPNQVVHAWNAMILDFPIKNLEFLSQLRESKATYLLSNTNEIHIAKVHQKLNEVVDKKTIHSYFKKVYFSSEMGMRKPTKEIFDFVINEQQLIPSRTLFIDDTLQHIEGAEKAGLKTHHLQRDEKIYTIFS